MARANGRRLAAAACFIIGGLTIIGIPIFWPIGYLLWKGAKDAEEERDRELDALDRLADTDQRGDAASDEDTALATLRERYAAGELTDEEFAQKRAALTDDDTPGVE